MATLVLLVCIAAIFCFFSQEFMRLFKKILAVKGVLLLLPLALASWFVFNYEHLVLLFLYYVRDVLNHINNFLTGLMPSTPYTTAIILIVLLTAISVAPVLLMNIWYYKKTYKPAPHPYLISTLIWIISSILLITLPALNQ